MGLSHPFIRRPIGTTLLALGLLLLGFVAHGNLPVAGLPSVELPSISVSAGRPGADPETMARTVAAPLERRLGKIAGVTNVSSVSTLGSANIWIEFDLDRSIDDAARDVQAALNAAATDLPSDLPNPPSFRKANPNAAPILVLALTSRTLPTSAVYDAADTTIAQRLLQVRGVADVNVTGSEQPAVRVRVNPARLASMGTSLEAVRAAIAGAVPLGPVGSIHGDEHAFTIAVNDQMRRPASYATLAVKAIDGRTLRLGDVAILEEGVRNSRAAAWFNGQPAVLVNVTRQADANVIETVEAIRALLPQMRRWVSPAVEFSVVADRTTSIRTSVEHMEFTLGLSVALVMLVVLLFLRRGAAVLAAGVTAPLSIAATFAGMWAVGYSIDTLSLLALTVAVGFIIDDAIVMVENVEAKVEAGMKPMPAALAASSEIGLTIVAISLSLVAAFIPLVFMGGVTGRFIREFALTLTFAVVSSTVVALTVTPMICAHLIAARARRPSGASPPVQERVMGWLLRFYARTLPVVLRHGYVTLGVVIATIASSVWLYVTVPKGLIPNDDTGLVGGWVGGASDISFPAMQELQERIARRVAEDPAVENVASSVGGGGWSASVNSGRLTITLRPLAERKLTTAQVLDRLRKSVLVIPGANVAFWSIQDVRLGGGQGERSGYQFALWGENIEELERYARLAVARLKTVPGIVDVNTDRPSSGLQARVVVDREEAARHGVSMQDVSVALNNAFAQRQVATLYGRRNQYRVVLDVEAHFRDSPADIAALYVSARGGGQVPLSAIATIEQAPAPLTMRHQNQFPSVTVTYNVTGGMVMDDALAAVRLAVAELHMPETVRVDFNGDLKALRQTSGSQPMLILMAILTVYIVLGVLYESLAHPLTILSTLPAAGLGALLALKVTGSELSIIAFIGIILLIGIVKKNGIMLVDFAIAAQRAKGLTPEQAAIEASLARFRPILMTTLAAMLGALPLVLATGPGAELRRPLGLTIVGGLLVSQILTLYTTPAVYVLMDRLATRLSRRRRAAAAVPAE
jgi:multidrug efflux pump